MEEDQDHILRLAGVIDVLRAQLNEATEARRHAQAVGTYLVEENRTLQAKVLALQNELYQRYDWEHHASMLQTQVVQLTAERDDANQTARAVGKIENERAKNEMKLARDLKQLRGLVEALPVVEEVTSDTVINIVQQHSFSQWLLKMLKARATLAQPRASEETRLREVLDAIRKKSYEPDPVPPALSTRAQIQLMAEAALKPVQPTEALTT